MTKHLTLLLFIGLAWGQTVIPNYESMMSPLISSRDRIENWNYNMVYQIKTDDSIWINVNRHIYDYDDDSDSIIRQNWENNNWINSWCLISDFDLDDNILNGIEKIWNGDDWIYSRNYNYSYSPTGLETMISQVWMNDGWVNDYSTSESDSALLYQDWIDTSWVNVWRSLYNDSGYVDQTWDTISLDSLGWVDGSLLVEEISGIDTIQTISQWIDSNWVYISRTYSSTINDTLRYILQGWDGENFVNLSYFGSTQVDNYPVYSAFRFVWESDDWIKTDEDTIITISPNSGIPYIRLSKRFDDGIWIEEERWLYTWENQLNVQPKIVANKYHLYNNYPNPFNPKTNLSYEIHHDAFVKITIYDLLGNEVNNLVSENQSSGYKSIQWNATNNQGEPVSAGVYLYKIQAGDFVDTKKMILLK